jgi:hypothetical protein
MQSIVPDYAVYRTSDLALAAALLLCYPLDAMDQRVDGAVVFVFRRDVHLDSLLERYWRGALRVEPQMYCQHVQGLQHRVCQKSVSHSAPSPPRPAAARHPPPVSSDIVLHPSLEIKDGVALVGFRYHTAARKEAVVYLVATDETMQYVYDDTVMLGEQPYVIERGSRLLMRPTERLHPAALWQCVEAFNRRHLGSWLRGREVFDCMRGLVQKYVELETASDSALLATWAIGTSFFPLFSAYPFLHVKAPKGSGKSQCLSFLLQVCFNAVKARPTFAALSDTVDALRGTYLIDQADALSRWQNADLTDILTDSYKRGGGKRRLRVQDTRGQWRTVEQETYSPKTFASIKDLPEDLRDRCLMVPLIRSHQNFLAPDEDAEDWQTIRGHLYQLLLTEHTTVADVYAIRKRESTRVQAITGRELELWLPLAVLLECVGASDELDAARQRFTAQYHFAAAQPSAFDEAVITAVAQALHDEERLVLAPVEIAARMDRMVFRAGLDAIQQAAGVGRAVRRLNLASAQATRSKRSIRYVFERAKVTRIAQHYLPEMPAPPPASTQVKDSAPPDDMWGEAWV